MKISGIHKVGKMNKISIKGFILDEIITMRRKIIDGANIFTY